MDINEKRIQVIHEICNAITPGKKQLQKLMYLIERNGLELGLRYSIHFYGPYSSKLDDYIHTLESLDVIKIEIKGQTHNIQFIDQEWKPHEIPEEKQKIDTVLNYFKGKSSIELEAITTLDYVRTTILEKDSPDEAIIAETMKIKGEKFKKETLEEQLKVLEGFPFAS